MSPIHLKLFNKFTISGKTNFNCIIVGGILLGHRLTAVIAVTDQLSRTAWVQTSAEPDNSSQFSSKYASKVHQS